MADAHRMTWNAITDLPSDWNKTLSNPQTHALVDVWKEQANELRQRDLFQDFLGRLRRQWAVETGIIEGLYDISEAGTKTLIEKGLDASFLSHEDTSQPSGEVIAKIKDHYDALMGLYQFVSGERPLGTSYIKELHQVLTAHQATYVGRDTLGNIVERSLPRGDWKKLPNNVELPDGSLFEYCPPEHVASEMDRLIELHHDHSNAQIPTDIEAAWLHHRFTLIHPFTDGNGRVARCLATLVLLKDHWLPLVVTRSDRERYILAIRKADIGDLAELVEFIGVLQRRAIREAISLSEEVISEAKAVASILTAVKEKFGRQRQTRRRLIDTSFRVADSLQIMAFDRLEEVASDIKRAIRDEGPNYDCWADGASRDSEHNYYFYHQTVQCAQALGYFADRRRYQAWARLAIVTDHRTEILVALHGIGHENAAVLGCAAMAYTREKNDEGDNGYSDVHPLSVEPFEFVYTEDATEVQRRFRRWLEECIVDGLDYWQKSV